MAEGGIITYTCDICGQDNLTEDDMKSHMLLEHVEGEISCPFCDVEGTSVDDMTWHINAEHLDAMTPTKVHVHDFPPTKQVNIRDASPPTNKVEKIPPGLDTKDSSDSSLASRLSSDYGKPDEKMDVSSESSESSDHRYDCETSLITRVNEDDQLKRRAKLHLDVTVASPRKKQQIRNDTVKSAFVETLKPCYDQIQVIRIAETPRTDEVLITTTDPNGNANIYTDDKSPLLSGEENSFSCPLCEWSTASPTAITRHVNVRHLDLLSPVASTSTVPRLQRDAENNNIIKTTPTNAMVPGCPFCGLQMESSSAMEIHVNTKHLDLLSPADPSTGRPANVTAVQSPADMLRTCPVCGMEDLEPYSLAQHVDGHFSAEQTPGRCRIVPL